MTATASAAQAERPGDAARELRGYVVWGLTGAAIAVPELWAAVDTESVPWPTISGTVGYIEYWHDWVAVLVIGVLVWGAFHAVKYARDPDAGRRTAGGRFTLTEPRGHPLGMIRGVAYYVVSVGLVLGGVALVHSVRPHDKFLLGEVLYGLIGFFGIVVPALTAVIRGRDVPFPTLFFTIQKLEQKARPVAILFAAGIVVLLIHLALYPWPSVIPDLQDLHKQYAQQRHEQLKQKEPSPYAP